MRTGPLKLIHEPLGWIVSAHPQSRAPFTAHTSEGRAEVQDRVMRTGKPCFLNVEWHDMVAVKNLTHC